MPSPAIPLPRSRGNQATTTQTSVALTREKSATQPSKAGVTSPKKPNPANGFGLLFLLLAALPFSEGGNAINPDPTCFNTRPTLATAANLRYVASLMDDVQSAGRSLMESRNTEEALDEDEETRRRRKLAQKRRPNDSLTSDNSDDDSAEFSEEVLSEHSTDSPVTASVQPFAKSATSALLNLGDAVLNSVASYLPLRDVTAIRRVSSHMSRAAEAVIPNPLPGSVFIRFEQDNQRGVRFATPPPRNLFRWICNYCNSPNPVGTGFCKGCGGGVDNARGVRRVFVGQLRKERTTELVEFMLASVYPDMEVFHIENHTSKQDGRGKGCAWVYVSNPHDEARIIDLNKRMFVDVDDNGREGIWYSSPAASESLCNMAAARSYKPDRPVVLPRQPLTCEKPQAKAIPMHKPGTTASSRALGALKDRDQLSPQDLYEQLSQSHSSYPQLKEPTYFSSRGARISVGFPPARNAVAEHYPMYPTEDEFQYAKPIRMFQHHASVPTQHQYDHSLGVTAPLSQDQDAPYRYATDGTWTYNPYAFRPFAVIDSEDSSMQ